MSTSIDLPALSLDPNHALPAIFAQDDAATIRRAFEFFAVPIRNTNTRRAYMRAVQVFLHYCGERFHLSSITGIQSLHVAAWIELRSQEKSAPTAKQELAALRHFFDYLTVGGKLPSNPAAAVRGPRHVIRTGKTPVLDVQAAGTLIRSIETDTLIGLRDRAIIGLMIYSFARVGAVVGMKVGAFYQNGTKWNVDLHEKGGRDHTLPVHHQAAECLHEWITAAGIAEQPRTPLFRSMPRHSRQITERAITAERVHEMVKKRSKAAGIGERTSPHSFRATGITIYLENGGTLENAQAIAGHADVKSTKLYDRRGQKITLDEIERIRL